MRLTLPAVLIVLVAGLGPEPSPRPAGPPSQAARDSALHVLNRLAYGPALGQVDAVAREGVMRWIDRQLAAGPGAGTGLGDRERAFSILEYSTAQLASMFQEERRARRAAQMAGDSGAGPGVRPNGGRRGLRELAGQLQELAIVRATFADAQLGEVMTDFWVNHFNVFAGKAADRFLLPEYVERTLRPRALGSFRDLLFATAKSPAMLVYLDNAQSVAPGSEPPALRRYRGLRPAARRRLLARRPEVDSLMRAVAARRPTGLNENYARELMELHTLGVDGGYTQGDVTEVARVLTGWSVQRLGGGFEYHDWAHDQGEKVVLGERFPAGHGQDEGERLLDLLATHPATMHHVSAKLCARFVSDTPPDGCVDDAVRAWQRSRGDVREVLRAIFHSPDFWAPVNVGQKVKTPLEFVVSAIRAVGAEPGVGPGPAAAVARLGQPLYQEIAPTGYPETEADWVNSGALLDRMNVALAIASGRLPGLTVDLDRVVPLTADRDRLVALVDAAILNGRMTENTRAVIRREIADLPPPAARTMAVALALGGPEFQRQ